MTATISIQLRTKLLRAYFTPDSFTGDDQLFVAVCSEVPMANSSGYNLSEPLAGAYDRCSVPLTSDFWLLGENGQLSNLVDLDFPPPDEGEDWGYLGGWALLDAPTGGMCQAVGALISPTLFTSDMPFLSIQPGGIVIGLYD